MDAPSPGRAPLRLLLAAALATAAALTLTPEGRGWAWGAPATELHWYATGLDDGATVLQLLGNFGLLVVPAALVVLLWPALGRLSWLTAAALTAGAGVEVLQWAMPLGRVVSPLDALLNAVGAVVAGLLVARVRRAGARAPARVGSPGGDGGFTDDGQGHGPAPPGGDAFEGDPAAAGAPRPGERGRVALPLPERRRSP